MFTAASRVAAVLILVALVTAVTSAPTSSIAQGSPTLDQIKSRGTLRLGWAVWFPYVFREAQSRELRGVSVEIFQEMAKALGVKAEFVEETWGTLVAGLQASKFEILNPLVITPERAQVADFTKPITRHGMGFLLLKANADKYRTWQDFDRPEKTIAVTLGSSTDVYLSRQLKNAQILRMKTQPDQVLQVLSGRADASFTSIDSLLFVQKEHPQTTIFRVPEFQPFEVAFALPKGDRAFVQWVNGFIDQQRASGNLRRLIEKSGLDASFLVE